MQVKNILSIGFFKKRKSLLIVLKGLISMLCIYFLIDRLQQKEISFTLENLPADFLLILLLQLPLMILNWFLEGLRWKVSIQEKEHVSLNSALTEVLSGLALNWVLPVTTGDLLARMVSKKDKYQATSAIFLNRMLMLTMTSAFGIYGGLHFAELNFELKYEFILAPFLGILLFIVGRKYLERFIAYFKEIEATTYWKIASLSVLRYAIFTFQYFLFLKLFLPEMSAAIILAGTGWIFVARSFVPSLFGGIGVREASALLFFQNLVPDLSLVVTPVFFLWLLNTVFPSLVGVILIWKLKLKIAE